MSRRIYPRTLVCLCSVIYACLIATHVLPTSAQDATKSVAEGVAATQNAIATIQADIGATQTALADTMQSLSTPTATQLIASDTGQPISGQWTLYPTYHVPLFYAEAYYDLIDNAPQPITLTFSADGSQLTIEPASAFISSVDYYKDMLSNDPLVLTAQSTDHDLYLLNTVISSDEYFDSTEEVAVRVRSPQRLDILFNVSVFEGGDTLYYIAMPSGSDDPRVTDWERCPSTATARLIVGMKGMLIGSEGNTLRSGAGTGFNRIGGITAENPYFTVLDGPVCANGYTWWQVRYGSVTGWTAEGESDGTSYWLKPVDDNYQEIADADYADFDPFTPPTERVEQIANATPTPVPTFDCLATTSQRLKLRSGPGMGYGQAGSFFANEVRGVIGQNTDFDDVKWYQLDFDVWVIAANVTTQGDCSRVPTVNP